MQVGLIFLQWVDRVSGFADTAKFGTLGQSSNTSLKLFFRIYYFLMDGDRKRADSIFSFRISAC